MPRGVSDFNVYWIRPSGAVVCANTAGAGRPDADSEGQAPQRAAEVSFGTGPALRGGNGIASRTTELRPYANFSSTNEGPWKLRLV